MAALTVSSVFRSDNLATGITFIGRKFTDFALLILAKIFLSQLNKNKPISGYGIFNADLRDIL